MCITVIYPPIAVTIKVHKLKIYDNMRLSLKLSTVDWERRFYRSIIISPTHVLLAIFPINHSLTKCFNYKRKINFNWKESASACVRMNDCFLTIRMAHDCHSFAIHISCCWIVRCTTELTPALHSRFLCTQSGKTITQRSDSLGNAIPNQNWRMHRHSFELMRLGCFDSITVSFAIRFSSIFTENSLMEAFNLCALLWEIKQIAGGVRARNTPYNLRYELIMTTMITITAITPNAETKYEYLFFSVFRIPIEYKLAECSFALFVKQEKCAWAQQRCARQHEMQKLEAQWNVYAVRAIRTSDWFSLIFITFVSLQSASNINWPRIGLNYVCRRLEKKTSEKL